MKQCKQNAGQHLRLTLLLPIFRIRAITPSSPPRPAPPLRVPTGASPPGRRRQRPTPALVPRLVIRAGKRQQLVLEVGHGVSDKDLDGGPDGRWMGRASMDRLMGVWGTYGNFGTVGAYAVAVATFGCDGVDERRDSTRIVPGFSPVVRHDGDAADRDGWLGGDGLVTGEGEAEEWEEKCPTFQLSTERRQ